MAEPPSERDYSRILELLRKREGEVVWLVIRSPKGSSRGAHWLLGKVSEGEADKLFVAARRYRSAWVSIAVDDIIHGAEFDPRIKTALRTIAFLVLPCALVTGLVIWPPLRLGLAVPLTIAGIWVLAKSTPPPLLAPYDFPSDVVTSLRRRPGCATCVGLVLLVAAALLALWSEKAG